MNSLEWRLKKLEDRVLGQVGPPQENIYEQLNSIAEQHKNFIDSDSEQTYAKFVELYNKHKQQADANHHQTTNSTTNSSRAELILAYEDDLTKYLNNIKKLADKADKVLDGHEWPDLREYEEKVAKLKTITKEQFLESKKVDEKTEELIQVYNDIIGAFKRNMLSWDSSLRDA